MGAALLRVFMCLFLSQFVQKRSKRLKKAQTVQKHVNFHEVLGQIGGRCRSGWKNKANRPSLAGNRKQGVIAQNEANLLMLS